ncbi:unnamed protein product [Nippostrongylus brasiliensis]|uniref:Inner membrane protein n=1 Tax=Nippostrongylus brasiliensis TaxID=27835 RepID=A0A0N4XVP3_NIPBR|nr:unnamed protein product [Nippostrongylus brasiliensis]
MFQYGTLWDFFMRYRCQYCLTVSFLLILLTVSAFAITKSLSKVERFSVTRLFLLITGIAIFTTNLIFMWMCLKYTIIRRIPRFNTRYRQITVFDYDGPETSMRESIVMNGPEVNKHVVSFQHNTHCKRSHEPLLSADSSLEQGFASRDCTGSWQISSTPIVDRSQQVVFTFDTPTNEEKAQKRQG